MTTQDLTDLKQLFEFAILTGDKPELTKSDCEMVVAAVDRVLKSEWRPIESAPKDVPLVVWAKECFGRERSAYVAMFESKYDWWEVQGVGGYEWETEIDTPTHWMPLPDPPKVSET